MRHVKEAQLVARKRGEVTVRKLLPETLAGLDLERMIFPARARMIGVPHTEGTREYLTCERGAIELEELPFVMGVLGDFTGQPVEPLAKLKDRKFVDVTPDNFDEVLASMKPHLAFTVENKLSEDPEAGKLGVDLHFESLDDFAPDQVARQVKPLREMLVGVAVVVIRNSLRFNIEGQQHRSSAEQRHVRESVRESTKCSTPNRTDGFLLF